MTDAAHIDGALPAERTTPYTIVILAASAGGLDAVTAVIERLPPTFALPVAVVLHRSAQLPNMLPDILDQRTLLPVRLVRDGESVEPGVIYVAAPTLHLTVDAERRFVCTDGATVNYVHSSADPLLRSAAQVYREGAIAVVLSGSGRDGAEGARAVAAAGGHVLVQDEASSQAFGMPGAAISTAEVDAVLPIEQIGPELVRLACIGRSGITLG